MSPCTRRTTGCSRASRCASSARRLRGQARVEAQPANGFLVLDPVVAARDRIADAAHRRLQRHHPVRRDELQRRQRLAVGGVFHRRGQHAAVDAQGHHPQPSRELRRQQGRRGWVGADLGQAHQRGPPEPGRLGHSSARRRRRRWPATSPGRSPPVAARSRRSRGRVVEVAIQRRVVGQQPRRGGHDGPVLAHGVPPDSMRPSLGPARTACIARRQAPAMR